jgi:hypothetical protein
MPDAPSKVERTDVCRARITAPLQTLYFALMLTRTPVRKVTVALLISAPVFRRLVWGPEPPQQGPRPY